MRFTGRWVLAIVVGALAVGCADPRRREMQEIRDAEQAIQPFTPAALRDSTRQHLVFVFRIAGDSLRFLPDSISLRPGRMPYRPGNAGDFRVAFLGAAADTLSAYSMEDPRILRSEDSGFVAVTVRTSGLVELPAPADTAIAFVFVSSASGVQRFPPIARFVLPPGILLHP